MKPELTHIYSIRTHHEIDAHTPRCVQQTALVELSRWHWKQMWPNYCPKCEGLGFHYYQYDPSPPGISLSPGYMVDCDPCKCIEKAGACPRCGEQFITDDNFEELQDRNGVFSCPFCDWQSDTPDVDMFMIPQNECYCWQYQEVQY